MIKVTLREDSPRSAAVIVYDKDGNELGELVIDQTPRGFRVNAYANTDTDSLRGTIIVTA